MLFACISLYSTLFFVIIMLHLTEISPTKSLTSLKKASSVKYSLLPIHGGFSSNEIQNNSIDDTDDDSIEVTGCPNNNLNGLYIKSENDINNLPHYERRVEKPNKTEIYHLYWSGNQWIIHHDVDQTANIDNMLAYAKVKVKHPLDTSRSWHVKVGKSFESALNVIISVPGSEKNHSLIENDSDKQQLEEIFGIPKRLVPLYLSFMLDSIAVGMAMPLLPFYVMELGAKAFQLSVVVSANYVVQMFGCILMGQVSDRIGRRFVLLSCLLASSLSYFFVSRSTTLIGVMLARAISGSCGGLVPVMQTCVADISSNKDRPKYLGRITATFGLGFVLGPALSALLPGLSTREKIRVAAILPFLGFIISFIFFKETKLFHDIIKPVKSEISINNSKISNQSNSKSIPINNTVILLVFNGFLIMYAFGTETIYAMFLKDSFGYGERTLSTLFAINGLFIGLFQIFFIKPMVTILGKHMTLVIGNTCLAFGMIGIALVRKEIFHFILFTIHIVGYSIADTALASLIARYSSTSTQGRDLALNQAAQSCARVLSPLLAGYLYEISKSQGHLPIGALPFLAGALCPAVGIGIPVMLYLRNIARKNKILKDAQK